MIYSFAVESVAEPEARTAAPRRARPSASDHLTEDLVAFIRERELKAGDRLPAVRQLADELGVTVPTLRESLRRLQAIGMLDMRHGSGIYLRTEEPRVLLANPYPGPLASRTIIELLDARVLIEPPLVALAAERARPADLDALCRTLDDAAESLERGDDDELHRLNAEFHGRIAGLAGNAILGQVLASMLELYGPEQLAVLRIYDDRRRDLAEHREICAALTRGDGSDAADLMRRHLEGVRDVVSARLGAQPST